MIPIEQTEFLNAELELVGFDATLIDLPQVTADMAKKAKGQIHGEIDVAAKLKILASFAAITNPFTAAEAELVGALYADFGRNWTMYLPYFYRRTKGQICSCYATVVARRIAKKLRTDHGKILLGTLNATADGGATMDQWTSSLVSVSGENCKDARVFIVRNNCRLCQSGFFRCEKEKYFLTEKGQDILNPI